MITLPRRLAFVLITCAAFVLGSAPVMAAPLSVENGIGKGAAPSSPQGIKSAVVVRAVKLVAKGIRKGNKHFGKVIEFLDKGATGPFLKHSARIADVLEDIAKIPDLAFAVVGQKLFSILTKPPFDLAGGVANTITQAIVGAISAAL